MNNLYVRLVIVLVVGWAINEYNPTIFPWATFLLAAFAFVNTLQQNDGKK